MVGGWVSVGWARSTFFGTPVSGGEGGLGLGRFFLRLFLLSNILIINCWLLYSEVLV
jgi:hypothetical protein